MGALIQTKGTQRLTHLFNNRFDKGSIDRTRAVVTNSGITLQAAFANFSDLLTISDQFIAQNANTNSNNWVLKGRDVLYPAATLIAVAVSGSDITFKDPALGCPDLIANNISAADLDLPLGVPRGAKVKNVSHNTAANQTTVTFDSPVAAQVGDRISFCPVKHQNLVRRWRYYLATELIGSNHSAIQGGVLTALTGNSVTRVEFQAIEDATQAVHVETIPGTTDDDDSNIDPTHKSLSIVLMTVRTNNTADPVDAP
jgi:hypothetical protein